MLHKEMTGGHTEIMYNLLLFRHHPSYLGVIQIYKWNKMKYRCITKKHIEIQ
jgi:hypothetical protein